MFGNSQALSGRRRMEEGSEQVIPLPFLTYEELAISFFHPGPLVSPVPKLLSSPCRMPLHSSISMH